MAFKELKLDGCECKGGVSKIYIIPTSHIDFGLAYEGDLVAAVEEGEKELERRKGLPDMSVWFVADYSKEVRKKVINAVDDRGAYDALAAGDKYGNTYNGTVFKKKSDAIKHADSIEYSEDW